MVLKSSNTKDINSNILCMKDLKGREYSSDILMLDVYGDNNKYSIGYILGESLDIVKSYPDYKKRIESLELLNKQLVNDNARLEGIIKDLSLDCKKSFDSLKQINNFQSEVIDNMNEKIGILTQRLFMLETKTKLL